MNIRTLLADEIECRVQTVKENGCSVLLYKDARCDMKILDEVFGPLGWQRSHEVINGNLFCNVSIWDKEKEQWIKKQDVGTESFTEKEKGQASDSFKRACFNLGIGRELYTAPFIWIKLNSSETYKGNNGNFNVKTKFHVSKIAYNDKKEIVSLEIKDDKGNVRYNLGQKITTETTTDNSNTLDKAKVDAIRELAKLKNISEEYICKFRKATKFEELSLADWTKAMEWLKKK